MKSSTHTIFKAAEKKTIKVYLPTDDDMGRLLDRLAQSILQGMDITYEAAKAIGGMHIAQMDGRDTVILWIGNGKVILPSDKTVWTVQGKTAA